ncbi:MAG: hypothetical protein ACT452_18435 [Microthrixaceae bacterium]
MDEVRQEALVRLYAGESIESICADLSITVDLLVDWKRDTDPEQLRPAGLPYVSARLSPPRQGVPRSELGMRVGPPDRLAYGVQWVHVVSDPADTVCARCGSQVIPERYQPSNDSWPALVLVEEAPEGRVVRLITDEEAELFPDCQP